jgi:hypothetical protein
LIEAQIAKLEPTYQQLCGLDWTAEEAVADVICEMQVLSTSPRPLEGARDGGRDCTEAIRRSASRSRSASSKTPMNRSTARSSRFWMASGG